MLYDDVVKVIKRHIPKFEIKKKYDSGAHRFADFLSKGWVESSMIGVVGFTMGVPEGYKKTDSADSISALVHEGTHALQAKRLTRFLLHFLYSAPFSFAVLQLALTPLAIFMTRSLPVWPFFLFSCMYSLLLFLFLFWEWDQPMRYKLELEAYVNELTVLWVLGRPIGDFTFKNIARKLSGLAYRRCVSYEKALEDIKRAWEEKVKTGKVLDTPMMWDIYVLLVKYKKVSESVSGVLNAPQV